MVVVSGLLWWDAIHCLCERDWCGNHAQSVQVHPCGRKIIASLSNFKKEEERDEKGRGGGKKIKKMGVVVGHMEMECNRGITWFGLLEMDLSGGHTKPTFVFLHFGASPC